MIDKLERSIRLWDIDNLAAMLSIRTAESPDLAIFQWYEDQESERLQITYAELHRQARAIAARLTKETAPGDRILLLYAPGLPFIAGFFGCLYAGRIAVPLYPPRPNRTDTYLEKIYHDCEPKLALTTQLLKFYLDSRLSKYPFSRHLQWLTNEEVAKEEDLHWQLAGIKPDSLAYLQYTSGSTSWPKGVKLTHKNVLNKLDHLADRFNRTKNNAGVSWLPPYHDMGLVASIFLPILTSSPAVLMSPLTFLANPLSWLQLMSEARGTVSGAPNFAYELCARRMAEAPVPDLDLSNWQVAAVGAEPTNLATLELFADTFEPYGFRRESFLLAYGLSEAVTMLTSRAGDPRHFALSVDREALGRNEVRIIPAEDEKSQTWVSNGNILPEHKMIIVDSETKIKLPSGSIGEIWVSGPSVGSGYWNKPQDNNHLFQAFTSGEGEGPFLRTGALGFLHKDDLYITGRIKDLIIIHGLNYYPQDVEYVAGRSHSALSLAGGAAFTIEEDGGQELVVVHEVEQNGSGELDVEPVASAIRQAIAEELGLPIYKVVLIEHGSLPRTPSAKVQRRACRDQLAEGSLQIVGVSDIVGDPFLSDEATSMRGLKPTEATLLQIWREVLESDQVDIHSNFFALGGNSLMATQVMNRLRLIYELAFPLVTIFDYPVISSLAEQVDHYRSQPNQDFSPFKPLPAGDIPPLSFAEERMWFLHQVDPDGLAYSIPLLLRIQGPLQEDIVKQCFTEIIRRHEIFRTRYISENGRPVRAIEEPNESSFPIQVSSLLALPANRREEHLRQRLEEQISRPFALDQGPLLQVALYHLAPQEHVVCVTMHHIIADAWSIRVLWTEIAQLYQAFEKGEPSPLPPLTIQYSDYAYRQREWFTANRLEEQLQYWRQHLGGNPPRSAFPTDHPRPEMQRYKGALETIPLPDSFLEAIHHLSVRENVTPFMTMLAACYILLYRYTQQDDLIIGTPIANRNWYEAENLIGVLVNTLALRSQIDSNLTFLEFLQDVRLRVLEAYDHQDVPFPRLVEDLQPIRELSYSPLYQVLFNVVNVPQPDIQHKSFSWELIDVDRRAAQFDLTISVVDTREVRKMEIEYNSDLFNADTIRRLLAHYMQLLQTILDGPTQKLKDLDFLLPAERHQLLVTWNDSHSTYPLDHDLNQMLQNQVEKRPQATAFLFENKRLTYQDLNQKAGHLAHRLQTFGVEPGTVVGLCLQRSLEAVIGFWAILKAGGVYLPLDPAYPQARLTYMATQTNATFIVTDRQHAALFQDQNGALFLVDAQDETGAPSNEITYAPVVTSPADPAYIIFTSGSTGRPKGVVLPHRQILNRLAWMWEAYPFQAGEVACQKTALSFVDSLWELLGALLQGRPTVIIPDEIVKDPRALVTALAQHEISRIWLVPSQLRLLLETHAELNEYLPKLHFWVTTGEPLPGSLWRTFHEAYPSAQLYNLYGISEVWDVSWHQCQMEDLQADLVPIGRPISNVQTFILDDEQQLLPAGVPGELVVAGDGLALGYYQQPALTAEKFIDYSPDDESPAMRLYKTGDRARHLSDGNLVYLGRRDNQLKIRGMRIEPGEIEALLTKHETVRQAVISLYQPSATNQLLVAYLIPDRGLPIDSWSLRRYLRQELPEYMVPDRFITVENIPQTPSGKTDRAALPNPEASVWSSQDPIAPRNETEAQLITLWQSLLGVQQIGVRDNFFDLGGHSFLTVPLMDGIRDNFGVDLPLITLFKSPTIEGLASYLNGRSKRELPATLVPLQPYGQHRPFFCVHGYGGDVAGYVDLANLLGKEQPFYGLQARGLDYHDEPDRTIEAMATHYMQAIKTIQKNGPYRLGGYCLGGVVAYEMARQLQESGEEVELLVVIEGFAPDQFHDRLTLYHPRRLLLFWANLPFWFRGFIDLGWRELFRRGKVRAKITWWTLRQRLGKKDPLPLDAILHGELEFVADRQRRVMQQQAVALYQYRPRPFRGPTLLIRAQNQTVSQVLLGSQDPSLGWSKLASNIQIVWIPGVHGNIMQESHVQTLALKLRPLLTA
jgi:amino acid adenylation domain-containing protein